MANKINIGNPLTVTYQMLNKSGAVEHPQSVSASMLDPQGVAIFSFALTQSADDFIGEATAAQTLLLLDGIRYRLRISATNPNGSIDIKYIAGRQESKG